MPLKRKFPLYLFFPKNDSNEFYVSPLIQAAKSPNKTTPRNFHLP